MLTECWKMILIQDPVRNKFIFKIFIIKIIKINYINPNKYALVHYNLDRQTSIRHSKMF